MNEAYCTVVGLPSDILLRGKTNHNRAIEGDVVAVELCKLADWFVIHKETTRVSQLLFTVRKSLIKDAVM